MSYATNKKDAHWAVHRFENDLNQSEFIGAILLRLGL